MRLKAPTPDPRAASVLLAALVVGWAILARQTSEHWWWVATLDLIPPQLLLPLFALLAWLAWRAGQLRWAAWNVLAAAAFVVVQVGLVLPSERPVVSAPITLLSLNTLDASADPGRIAQLARREGADVVVLQEALFKDRPQETYAARVRAAFPGWSTAHQGELLTLTRLPLLESRPLRFPQTGHVLLVTRLQTRTGEVTVVNVHLPTLALLTDINRPGEPRALPGRVAWRLHLRRELPGAVSQVQATAPGAVVLVGDMNAPARGELHRLLRATGLRDAFVQAGAGFGFTYAARLGFLRLDYTWGDGVVFTAARALPEVLSDHRPLLVRFGLHPGTTSSSVRQP
ncbi:endonuclease/exonuclease/phosphatase family protein [Deinococcus humi]|uniref:Vancomycin resistance protein VanJ n=1 Tax=Deinococcus humi TaxID=662880 RepID=A0A7W8NGE6_9DEIO|nr:endonuclease/exonuclease/phosphatase family protein [Deinococcus humi]MBB5366434.1 vancomycin resistance protein VanJ [Deinococcus humi]